MKVFSFIFYRAETLDSVSDWRINEECKIKLQHKGEMKRLKQLMGTFASKLGLVFTAETVLNIRNWVELALLYLFEQKSRLEAFSRRMDFDFSNFAILS